MTVPVLKMRDYFDIDALYAALDAQRGERGLTWGGVMREINGTYRDVDLRPIAASTITTMRDRDYLNGDGVIQMLLWLDRTPESFVPGHPSPNAPENRLIAPARTDRILRFRPAAVYWAADEVRRTQTLTWIQVAADIGCISANGLQSLGTGRGLLGFPKVVHIARWLDIPMAALTLEREW